MSDVPARKNLKKLSLRAAVALSLRATQRVKALLPNILIHSETAPNISDERVFNIELLLVKSFCDGTLHRNSTRLAEIMEDTKWDPKNENFPETDDPVFRSGHYAFSAAMRALFGHFIEAELPTFSTAQCVIDFVDGSLTSALEASLEAGKQYHSPFLEGIWWDYESLFAKNTALFPEYGPAIDTTPEGFLGPLWHGIGPSVISTAEHENRSPNMHFSSKYQSERRGCDCPTHDTGSFSPKDDTSPQEGYLYKYVSFQTLLKVLNYSTLMFSPVSSFNDPFDGQLLPIRKFGWKQFFAALREESTRLATAKNEPIFQLPADTPTDVTISSVAHLMTEFLDQKDRGIAIFPECCDEPGKVEPLSKCLRLMIYFAQIGGFASQEEALSVLNYTLDLFQNHRMSFPLQDADRRMIPALADIIHILCLSEVPDSLLMWSHYADKHTGAVLKFDIHSESAGYFKTAQPVNYEKELPSIESPRNLARRYLGLDEAGTDSFSLRQFFTKSAEWKYEKEWRVMAKAEMCEQGDFIPFQKESLVAIYLGCRLSAQKIRRALDLVIGKQYPTDIYMAVKDESEFSLSFVPISNGRTRSSASPDLDIDERARLYRWCLDAYFEFWNGHADDLIGERRRLRSEGILADYGPPNSMGLFRELIQKLEETIEAKPRITADREKEREEYEGQYLKILQPSAKAYGTLEDTLKEDLAVRGGTLPEHKEVTGIKSGSDVFRTG